jgi:S-adenosyl methyltransferase
MSEPVAQSGVRVPVGVDPTRASIARVYDATLGGKDNYAVDREVVKMIEEIAPGQSDVARMNRRWLVRVVRHLAGEDVGIDQFLDVGSGLPTVENTHEVAQQRNPEAHVVYVDNDPVCNAYGRALLEANDRTHFVSADLTEPETLLAHPDVTRYLDLTRPLALILCGILHHVDDELDPVGIMSRYIDALPSGSYVAITSFWNPDEGTEASRMAKELERRFTTLGLGSGWYRTREEIEAFFCGLPFVPPGLVELDDWWPPGPALRPRPTEERLLLGGVARKP